MIYSHGRDIMFVVLALISSLAMISMHHYVALIFLILAITYVIYEYEIEDYIKNAKNTR